MNHTSAGDSNHPTQFKPDPEDTYMEEIELDYEPININRTRDIPVVDTHFVAQKPVIEEDDSEILGEILHPVHLPTPQPDESNPPSSGFIVISGFPTSETSFSAITRSYAPLTVQREDGSHSSNLDLNFTAGGQITPFRESYIPSSQELLRQVQPEVSTIPSAAPTATETAPAPTKRHWATPLKLGGIAAACVVAGAGAYTAFNPSILTPLAATNTSTVATTTTNLGQLIQSPNLAANEFTELNLSTLNTVKVATAAPTTTPSTIANPVGAMTPTAPTAIAFNPTNTQSIAPPGKALGGSNRIQPKLADSLIKSLLPANFQALQPQNPGVSR